MRAFYTSAHYLHFILLNMLVMTDIAGMSKCMAFNCCGVVAIVGDL